MTYELWDTDVGNLVAHRQSDVETALLIRALVDHHGTAQADSLSLSIDDADGNQEQLLTGAGLVHWANGVLEGSDGPRGRDAEPVTSVTSNQRPR
jgi:hypothetical protein